MLAVLIAMAAICSGLTLSGCETYNDLEGNGVTVEGTIPLSSVNLGTRESALKEARITFTQDLSAAANAGGRSQFLSREKTAGGGQYVVQCKNGNPFRIEVIYQNAPVPKEAALALAKGLLPKDAPPQSRVDDESVRQHLPEPRETYFFGEDYIFELFCADKNGETVKSISATNLQLLKQAVEDSKADQIARRPLVENALKREEMLKKAP